MCGNVVNVLHQERLIFNSPYESIPSSDSLYTSATIRMGRELRYFFMNPIQKYKARKRIPFKLIIQVIKIILVTVQVILYGSLNQNFTGFADSNKNVIDQFVFSSLKNESRLIDKRSFYEIINDVRQKYIELPDETVGIYDYKKFDLLPLCETSIKVELCITQFDKKSPNLSDDVQNYDVKSNTRSCYVMKDWNKNEEMSLNSIPLCNGSSIQIDFVGKFTNNKTLFSKTPDFSLISADIRFTYETMWMGDHGNHYHGRCFDVKSNMKLSNYYHSGLIKKTFTTEIYLIDCQSGDKQYLKYDALNLTVDAFIIILCLSSSILCMRSIYRAYRFKNSFTKFYEKRYDRRLDFWDKFEFVNLWHFLIIISDTLTLLGIFTKISYLYLHDRGLVDLNICSIFLGIGCLCIWIGVLRYVGYFHQYNKLVLTLKLALPHVMRFMVCASILYFGFMFCGWIVLGPYHRKFRSLVVTSEALFSLINGDDMYMTYEEMSLNNQYAWVFSQIYLYLFISLFIYVVLSLFIAVITDTYEMIKDWQREGKPPKSKIEQFLDETSHLNDQYDDYLRSDTYCFCCCYRNNDPDFDTESFNSFPQMLASNDSDA